MKPIFFLLLLLSAVSARPQNLLSDIASVFGLTDDDPSTPTPAPPAPPAQTLAPATTRDVVTTPTPTPKSSHVRTTISSPTQTSSSSSSDDDSSTSTSTDSDSSTSTSTTTSTTSSSTTTTPTPTSPPPTPLPSAPDSTNQPSSTGISGGGIAVAVIMSLAILAAIAWLIFRYHPGVRRWWEARQERKMQERSYRDALDGPSSRGARNQALGVSRRSTLASFFAPRNVQLGGGQSIRRKPVNWGATDAPPVPELPDHGVPMEKVALAKTASPMGRSESTKSHVSSLSWGMRSYNSGTVSSVSSPTLTQKELPPVPPMPPMPPEPTPAAKKGDMYKILSRKSIFELA